MTDWDELQLRQARDLWFEEFLKTTIEFWQTKLHGIDKDSPTSDARIARCKGYLDALLVIRSNYYGRRLETFLPKEWEEEIDF